MSGDDSDPATSPLRLAHFLKMTVGIGTGGQAKLLIQSGEVKVNGEIETRRRRKLSVGDVIEVSGKKFSVDQDSVRTMIGQVYDSPEPK